MKNILTHTIKRLEISFYLTLFYTVYFYTLSYMGGGIYAPWYLMKDKIYEDET